MIGGVVAPDIRVISLADAPEIGTDLVELAVDAYPPFVLSTTATQQHWQELLERRPEFQFALVDVTGGTRGKVIGGIHSVPLAWCGDLGSLPSGWDGALRAGVRSSRPSALCALSIVVAPNWRRHGIAPRAIAHLQHVAHQSKFRHVIAPVRPTRKEEFPLIPIGAYAQWTQDDGLPYDPWLRAHVVVGGKVAVPAPRSMTTPAPVATWEAWTGRSFPGSGRYVVPGALAPITIDLSRDRGLYVEPNVWMVHGARDANPFGASE